mgnify:CR=1 FL=1
MEELKQERREKRGGRQNRQTLFGNNSAEMAEMEGNSRNGMEPQLRQSTIHYDYPISKHEAFR